MPRECTRLMGFESPQDLRFHTPVSDTQVYHQLGSSAAVPVFAMVVRLLAPRTTQAMARREADDNDDGCS